MGLPPNERQYKILKHHMSITKFKENIFIKLYKLASFEIITPKIESSSSTTFGSTKISMDRFWN